MNQGLFCPAISSFSIKKTLVILWNLDKAIFYPRLLFQDPLQVQVSIDPLDGSQDGFIQGCLIKLLWTRCSRSSFVRESHLKYISSTKT